MEGTAPSAAVAAKRLDRHTALRKPNGGVRGIVASDVVRRLVARAVAQQIGSDVEAATSPHQYALSTPSWNRVRGPRAASTDNGG